MDTPQVDNAAPAVVDNAAPTAIESPAPQGDATKVLSSSWTDSLSDDLKSNQSILKFKTQDDLAKSYINLEKLVGSKGIPADDASDEVKAEFYKRLGRPDSPDGYDIPSVEGIEFKKEVVDKFRQIFHANGLSKKAADGILKEYGQFIAEEYANESKTAEAKKAEQQAKHQQEFDSLKQLWGSKFDENVVLAQRAQRAFGVDADTLDKIESAIGSKALIEMFHRIGSAISDDKIVEGQQTNTYTMTPQQAKIELHTMLSDPKIMEALNTPNHPMKNVYNDKRLKLISIANKAN